jgi:hypothetical protein
MRGPGTMFRLDDQLKNKIYYTNCLDLFDTNSLKDIPRDRLVIVDKSGDTWGSQSDNFYKTLEDHQFNFLLLSHLPIDHLRRPRLLHYQPFNFYGQQFFTRITDQSDIKKYKLSCLNLNPHTHRIKNYLLFKKKKYFDQCLFSFHTARPEDLFQHYARLSAEMALEWQSIQGTLPSRYDLVSEIKSSGSDTIMHPAYTDSYINLVTESSVRPDLFVTEKTWKPVAAAQLFLIFGTPGIIQYLREQGVDTFDDYINHDVYDSEPDWEVRLNNIHALIDDLVTKDLAQIYQDTKERRLQNQQKFFNGKLDNGFFDDLKLAITRYSCINMPN